MEELREEFKLGRVTVGNFNSIQAQEKCIPTTELSNIEQKQKACIVHSVNYKNFRPIKSSSPGPGSLDVSSRSGLLGLSLRPVDDDDDGLVGGGVSLHDHPEGVDHTRTPEALGQHDWDLYNGLKN